MKLIDKSYVRRICYSKDTGLPKFDRLIKLGCCYLYILHRYDGWNLCSRDVEGMLKKKNEAWRRVNAEVYNYHSYFLQRFNFFHAAEVRIDFRLPYEKNSYYTMWIELDAADDRIKYWVEKCTEGGRRWSGHIDCL